MFRHGGYENLPRRKEEIMQLIEIGIFMDSNRKCKFHRLCPARSDCNNIAHRILSFYKLQGTFN